MLETLLTRPPSPPTPLRASQSIGATMPPPLPILTNQMPPSPLPPPLVLVTKQTFPKLNSNTALRPPTLATPAPPRTARLQPHQLQQNQQIQIRPPVRRSSAIVVPATRRPSLLQSPTQRPKLTRRGSLMLTATMRAMGQSLPHATLAALTDASDPPRPTNSNPTPTKSNANANTNIYRRKSNQDNDRIDGSDSDSDSGKEPTPAVGDANNQTPEQLPTRMRPSPPPYFRLETFMLNDHDATSPTSHVLPSSSSSSPSCKRPNAPPPPPSKTAQIDLLFREIIQTEASYVGALRGLVTQFFEPLRAFAKIHAIELGAMAALHHATSTILSIHDELLRQLEPLHSPPPPPLSPPPSSPLLLPLIDPFGVGFTGTLARLHLLSQAFLSTIEYMKVYAFYCGSYLAAKQELETLQRTHPKLAQFAAQLNECARRGSQEDQEEELPPLDINSSLIKPVQRICRYPLLFKNLLRNATGPEETLVLQQTLQKIEAVSNYVNEKVRESQHNARLYELHQMLHHASGIELLQPSRTLIYEAWAHVTSLDAMRWPARLLQHFSFRRRRASRHSHSRGRSRGVSLSTPVRSEDWFRLFGLGGDDRRSSATATAQSLRSQTSTRGHNADRHTSFSAASTTTQYVSSPRTNASGLAPPLSPPPLPPCLHQRRSSGGERSRLILLSDMLLMAKLRDHKLKIRRQICLSCAVVHDDLSSSSSPPPPPPSLSIGDDVDDGGGLPPPVAVAADTAEETVTDAFTLEVSKVGRCACHHLTPLTLRRSPRHRSLSAFLSGRRGSGSLASSSSTSDLFQALQQQQQQQHETPKEYSRTTSKSSSSRGLRYLEQLAGLRAVKRYRVTCDSVQEKIKFLRALRQAIARSARLQSLGGTHSTSGSDLAGIPSHASSASKAVAIAVSLPVKIWRSIRSTSETTTAAVPRATASQSRRRAGSLAVASRSSSSVGSSSSALGDLLQLEDIEARGQVHAA